MSVDRDSTEVAIAGGGLAGLVAALELLDHGKRVLILDKDRPDRVGGLAREAFGGILLVGTPEQRRGRIRDNPELALSDWQRYAEFDLDDDWPRAWARFYCERCEPLIYRFLRRHGVKFLPVVNWPERGWDRPGNSVPRWHVVWGLGREVVTRLWGALERHPRRDLLDIRFHHDVTGLDLSGGKVAGLHGTDLATGGAFRVRAEHVVIAAGGICGGDLSTVRRHWHAPWGTPPARLLNGGHDHGDGQLHELAAAAGARLTHLDRHWHYAAGVHHPRDARPDDGLSLVPPRSALWCNARGERIGPPPLVANSDTRHLVETVLHQPGQYSWQVLNHRIARRELAVSGYDFMDAFCNKRPLKLLRQTLFGNRELVARLLAECPEDFAVADTPAELATAMTARNLDGLTVDADRLTADIRAYDAEIDRGPTYFVDAQLCAIARARRYRGDRVRTCRFQKILDPRAGPLIAIREFILSRKSLGGIQTDLDCRVRGTDGRAIAGLYAIGEAAGFGGGGINGKRALEGTFIGGCVLTGRRLGQHIGGTAT